MIDDHAKYESRFSRESICIVSRSETVVVSSKHKTYFRGHRNYFSYQQELTKERSQQHHSCSRPLLAKRYNGLSRGSSHNWIHSRHLSWSCLVLCAWLHSLSYFETSAEARATNFLHIIQPRAFNSLSCLNPSSRPSHEDGSGSEIRRQCRLRRYDLR